MRPAAYIQHHVMGEDELVFTKDDCFDHTPLYLHSKQTLKPSKDTITVAKNILDPNHVTSTKEDLVYLEILANEIIRLSGKK